MKTLATNPRIGLSVFRADDDLVVALDSDNHPCIDGFCKRITDQKAKPMVKNKMTLS
jgi:hypothetical protein